MSRSTPRGIEKEGIWGADELEDKATQPTQWGVVGTDSYKALSFTKKRLPNGAYIVTKDNSDGSIIFIKKPMNSDDLLQIKDSFADDILKDIQGFWELRDKFKENGFLHRRGYLLYGPQGVGKSSIVGQIVADVESRNGLTLICQNPMFFTQALKTIRQVEPDRPLLCVFEDIDAIIKHYGEDELLSILDGANQIDHVLNVATTNYPEMLDRRIISRPRRFDRVHKMLEPGDVVRKAYLKAKLPTGENVNKWLKATKGLSFAAMAEAIVSVVCLGNKMEDTIKILKDMEHGHPSSDDFRKTEKLGFGSDDDEVDDDEDSRPRAVRVA